MLWGSFASVGTVKLIEGDGEMDKVKYGTILEENTETLTLGSAVGIPKGQWYTARWCSSWLCFFRKTQSLNLSTSSRPEWQGSDFYLIKNNTIFFPLSPKSFVKDNKACNCEKDQELHAKDTTWRGAADSITAHSFTLSSLLIINLLDVDPDLPLLCSINKPWTHISKSELFKTFVTLQCKEVLSKELFCFNCLKVT